MPIRYKCLVLSPSFHSLIQNNESWPGEMNVENFLNLIEVLNPVEILYHLQSYFNSMKTEFDQFIEENKNNTVIWSSSININSKGISDDQCKRFSIRKYIRMCINNIDTITSLIKNVKNDIITREKGIVQAYKLGFTPSPLSITAPLISTNIVVTNLVTLTSSTLPEQQIEKLPNQDIMEDVLKFELCHRYIDPIMSGLFDDPDKSILFRCFSCLHMHNRLAHSQIPKHSDHLGEPFANHLLSIQQRFSDS
ncbi:uncharacterized protein BX663DRAFT_555880 [Cokeromyces recurvatus]|uniref:uncharacterized protein n=1 Tax=Cokeromyces recurvatus TaxID=90255 RepID=UPI00221FF574|nr:uncharacterized protein BX663DRAFT_555880 [Cokeromyces recurvatus]KAI7898364.1 hypothetical protein BX663DRAFT_555880 [Cokeromyces recurvatus]